MIDAMTATCIISSRTTGHILRNRTVTTFEEVQAIHKELPRNDIAIFESDDGHGGEMWAFYPDDDRA